jgi:LPS export ABC transporter protein LptC
MRHGPQTLFLRRDVQLVNDQTGARLETRAMTLNLRRKTAVSRVPVTISQGENQTRANGMVADLNLEQIRLQPNVESIYVPPPR